MVKTALILILFCCAAFGRTLEFEGAAAALRTRTYSTPVVIVTTQPSWCWACQLYEPIFAEVSNLLEFRNVRFYVNTTHHLLEGPRFIPWTYVYTGNERCNRSIDGLAAHTILIEAIRSSQRCLEGR